MKTLIIQSYRTQAVPAWIARCLASVRAWAQAKGYDHWLTDDRAFALCGEDYLARVGDNPRSKTNLCRLELIRSALADGYDLAIWMDADIFVFAPQQLDLAAAERISFPHETWLWRNDKGWGFNRTLNNCVIVCPRNDPDLDLIIRATRHRALHHPVTINRQVGVDLIRGLHQFLQFPLLGNVGMLSNHSVIALAQNNEWLMRHQAQYHQTPIYAANLCASDHLSPVVPEALTHLAMDMLEQSCGDVINRHLMAAA